jgi:hypothetical protein
MADEVKRRQPPQPPEVRRRVAFLRYQLIGMPFIIILPVLGAFGVFDNKMSLAKASAAGIELEVRYYRQLCRQSIEPMTVEVTNSSQAPATLEVEVDRSAVEAEDALQIRPEPKELDSRTYRFQFRDVPPGAMRTVEIDLGAGRPGMHRGSVRARSGASVAAVELETFSFP